MISWALITTAESELLLTSIRLQGASLGLQDNHTQNLQKDGHQGNRSKLRNVLGARGVADELDHVLAPGIVQELRSVVLNPKSDSSQEFGQNIIFETLKHLPGDHIVLIT